MAINRYGSNSTDFIAVSGFFDHNIYGYGGRDVLFGASGNDWIEGCDDGDADFLGSLLLRHCLLNQQGQHGVGGVFDQARIGRRLGTDLDGNGETLFEEFDLVFWNLDPDFQPDPFRKLAGALQGKDRQVDLLDQRFIDLVSRVENLAEGPWSRASERGRRAHQPGDLPASQGRSRRRGGGLPAGPENLSQTSR